MSETQRKPTVPWVLFGFRGRIGRQSYILGQLFMLSLFAVVIARIVAVEDQESATVFWGMMFLLLGGVSLVSMVAMTVKRLNDLSIPGVLAVCLFIAPISFFFVVALMIMPSKQEVNRHGPPPFGMPSESPPPPD